eukprot:CAMPEP_0194224684 /NCGR_PEP_ID=MMETSP0156-20130528/37996_1 /TAXON_ID=33649 /ORGANISM="Thalassionema nitzschioides, Strain L26-B" /LENGTH=386 /DNA_ID=CAMNT_0038956359 /DNA_START=173 /DNA_END=1333 /DNA_ORIENTATION=+
MMARFIYFLLLLLLAEVCSAGIPGGVRVRSIFSSSNNEESKEKAVKKPTTTTLVKKPIDVQNTIMRQIEVVKNEIQQKISHVSKESEALANEAVLKAEQQARERLQYLEEAAVAEAQRLSEEASNHALEKLSSAENAILSKLSELEQDAMDEAQRRVSYLETSTRAKLSAIEQKVESKIRNVFEWVFPPKFAPLVPLFSDKNFERLFKALVSLVLISAFGNLSGQIKAWDVWEVAAFRDQYFPFPVDFVSKRILAGLLDLVALGLLTIPNSAKDITTRLGSAMVAIIFGHAALIHEGGFMFAFSAITAIVAAIVILNDFWLVPSKDLTRSPRRWHERKNDVQITVAVLALVLILKRTLAEESIRDRFDSVFHRSKNGKKEAKKSAL